MKRTNVVLDEGILRKAKRFTGLRTTRKVLDHALHELVRHGRQREILSLRGRVEWEGDLQALRRGRSFH